MILAGDFNLPPSDAAWAGVGTDATPLIQGRATTLDEEDGRFVSAYDNLWVVAGRALPLTAAGVLDTPAFLGMSHSETRDRVSDHAPVWLALDAAAPLQVLEPWTPAGPAEPVASSASASSAPAPAPVSAEGRAVVGNANSYIYHLEGCPSFNSVGNANRVPFPSPAAAEAEGYRLARNCQ